MKRFIKLIILLIFISSISVSAQTNSSNNFCIKTIVLDAGHGGKDPGCQARGHREKDVTLSLVKKLGDKIKKEYPDINVIYTRKSDVFIELYQRAAIANKNHADLFISIHCNASKNTHAYGTETFVMGLHKSKENFEVAKLENASILYEDDYEENYDGYDPNSPESNIIFTLMQNAFLDQSLTFASYVEDNFVINERKSRGIKQAGFLVLYKTSTPCVLIEAGFITNEKDRAILVSNSGQEKIANSIFEAFKTYKNVIEAKNNLTTLYNNNIPNDLIINTSIPEEEFKPQPNIIVTDTTYKVQFMSMSKEVNTNKIKYNKLKDIEYYLENKTYKYTTGKFNNKVKATEYLNTVKELGYKDAFIVAFVNNKKVK